MVQNNISEDQISQSMQDVYAAKAEKEEQEYQEWNKSQFEKKVREPVNDLK